jgi:hypothetical protein
MSINVIERNGSDNKYVEIFTHRVGSIGAPSRKTVFIRGTNTKQWEIHKIAGRNTKAKHNNINADNNNNNNNNANYIESVFLVRTNPRKRK